MSADYVKGDRVQLSMLGFHELVVRRPKQRTLKSTSVGIVGRASYCDGCVYVKFDGRPSFEDFASVYLRPADVPRESKAA